MIQHAPFQYIVYRMVYPTSPLHGLHKMVVHQLAQEYVKRIMKKNGTMGWQGGKNLPDSAQWTESFCASLLKCWEEDRAKFGPGPAPTPPQQHLIKIEIDWVTVDCWWLCIFVLFPHQRVCSCAYPILCRTAILIRKGLACLAFLQSKIECG